MVIWAAIPMTFISCGDDEDDEDVSGGNIVGTWQSDLAEDIGSIYEDYYENVQGLVQFKNDGTYINVSVIVWKDDWVEAFGGPKEEIDYERGTWKTSGDKIYMTCTESSDPEDTIGETDVCTYQVKGKKLTVTTTRGIIITTTFTRVSDSMIQKYLK